MSALIQGELLKLRTTRTFLGFLAAGVLLVLAVVLLSTLAGDPVTLQSKRDAIGVGGVVAVVLLVFGVVGATGEYRHRTLAPSLLVAPDRARLTVARMAAYALGALVIGVAMVVVALVIGLPLLSGTDGPGLGGSDVLEVSGGGLIVVVLYALIGVAFGVLVRNQVAAVVGVLVYLFVVEPLLGLLGDDVARFLLLNAGAAVGSQSGDELLSFGAGLAVLLAWAAVLLVAGVLVDRRRDVT